MNFHLDSGKFPQQNYNRVLSKSKRVLGRIEPTVMTQQMAMGMYRVVQDMNSVREPTLAIKGKRRFL
jgi:hypothetical protein